MSENHYEMGDVLSALVKNKKLTFDDKNWVAAQLNKQHDRDMEIKAMEAFAADPELKYWVGAGVGLGAAWIVAMFDRSKKEGQPEQASNTVTDLTNIYETILGAGSPLLSAAGIFDFNKDNVGGLAGNMMQLGTASWTAWNMVCLLLRNAGQDSLGPLPGMGGA